MSALSRKHFKVELTDGRVLELESVNADQLQYEATRARRKWPMITESGVQTWWTFLAWAAAARTGAYAGTWDQWTAEAVDIENTDDDEADGVPVDPTRPAVAGS